jgi:hypothetical protein
MTPAITICFSGYWAFDTKLSMFITENGEVSFSQAGSLRSDYENNWFDTLAQFTNAVKRYLKNGNVRIDYVKVWGKEVEVCKEEVLALITKTLKAGF